jgi:hypothetical protein
LNCFYLIKLQPTAGILQFGNTFEAINGSANPGFGFGGRSSAE